MREIKFRAWDEIKNRWLETSKDVWLCVDDGRTCTLETTGGYEAQDFLKGCTVILMQFTGLRDKNGKDIYEGDLIRVDENAPMHEVVFLEDGHWFAKCLSNTNCFYLSAVYKIMNIVSNIYEFPELLKSEQEPERSVASKAE